MNLILIDDSEVLLPNISVVGELKQMFVVVVVFISGTSHKISKQEKGQKIVGITLSILS